MGSSCSKDPNSPMTFREGFLKVTFGVRLQFVDFLLIG